ncbi:MAG: 30S ribosome-binding factor RbfA [Candidatus Bipolaricaulia bacterium]
MNRRRRARLREDLQRELAAIVEFESRDPIVQAAFPTVMDVRLSPDARYARVFVAAGATIDRAELERALEHDRGFYRSLLAERLDLRHTPELRFEIDETVERAMRLEEIIRANDASTHPDRGDDQEP